MRTGLRQLGRRRHGEDGAFAGVHLLAARKSAEPHPHILGEVGKPADADANKEDEEGALYGGQVESQTRRGAFGETAVPRRLEIRDPPRDDASLQEESDS